MDLDRTPITVFVPAAAERTTIRLSSGIVGTATSGSDRLRIDYEGDTHGPTEQFAAWADRVHHAWGRHVSNYPTVARSEMASEELIAVGMYDPLEGVVTLHVSELEQVAAWLQLPTDAVDEQLQTRSVVRHQQRREIRQALAAGKHPRQAIAAYARRYGHEDLLT